MDLGAGLHLARSDATGWRRIVAPGGEAIAAVAPDHDERRGRLGLTFLSGDRVLDVSSDPEAWLARLAGRAVAAGEHPGRWAAVVTGALDRFGIEQGWWNEPYGTPPAVSAALAWPLLRPAIGAGHDLRRVPQWATGLVCGPDLASASRRTLARRADRRVIRELGHRLCGPVHWWPVALAVALPPLDAGRLGDLLNRIEGRYCCDADEMRLLRNTLGRERPDLVAALLRSACVDADDNRPTRLLTALDGWQRSGPDRPIMPVNIDRLEAVVAEALVVAPPSPERRAAVPAPPAEQRERVHAVAAGPERPAVGVVPYHPPPVDDPAPCPDRFDHPDAVRRLHGQRVDDVEISVPTGSRQLDNWGRLLTNCLADFAAPVAAGRSIVVGIRVRGCLAGAAEIDPRDRRIRQILGPRNERLTPSIETRVVDLLVDTGAVRPGRRR